MPIQIYTDGACKGNPGPGGWGVVITDGKKQKHLSGYVANTTNNQMELQAAIEAVKFANRVFRAGTSISIYTDSQYVYNGITKWLTGWKRNGWRTVDRKPVKNKEFWEQLDVSLHDIQWFWVRAHNGNVFNELADKLATTACNT